MKRRINLRRSLLSDPHLWIAFAAIVVFVLLDILHGLKWIPWEVPESGILFLIPFVLLAIITDRLQEGEELKENALKLNRMVSSLENKNVSLRRRPSTSEDYEYLWGGFRGMYYVYNPSYRVDKNAGKSEIVPILIERYRSPHFEKARYIFLTQDNAGKEDLAAFRELMHLVKDEYPGVVNKIEVKEIASKGASLEAEMYVGTRDGKRVGVMELKEPSLNLQHGMPHYYLLIHDHDMLEHYCADHFEAVWNSSTTTDISNFWS